MALGAEPGGLHKGYFAFLSTSKLFENSCECSSIWWMLAHSSGLLVRVVPWQGGCVGHVCFAFLTCSDLFRNSCECSSARWVLIHV